MKFDFENMSDKERQDIISDKVKKMLSDFGLGKNIIWNVQVQTTTDKGTLNELSVKAKPMPDNNKSSKQGIRTS